MSSGFISEAELEERRRFRQEEWEKVRKPDEPMEAPEEQYDHRSLFERLQEQKQKKEMEYQESIKLKNMIKGLDDEEVEFLDLVEQRKAEEEKRKWAEEAKEMRDFREAVVSLQEQSLAERLTSEIRRPPCAPGNSKQAPPSLSKKNSQHRLLAGALVKKRPPPPESLPTPCEKRPRRLADSRADGPHASSHSNAAERGDDAKGAAGKDGCRAREEEVRGSTVEEDGDDRGGGSRLRCIGILPGLGSYPDSSDSDASESTDEDLPAAFSGYDLCGRKVGPTVRKAKQEGR